VRWRFVPSVVVDEGRFEELLRDEFSALVGATIGDESLLVRANDAMRRATARAVECGAVTEARIVVEGS
jgi:hypothetical protein